MADSTSPWRPLRNGTFRNLLAANVISDVGAFMQTVGAAWLMVSFGASSLFVALMQTAGALPFFLLALPAGAVGDIVDRRRLILVTETWMAIAASALAIATVTGRMSPPLLLILTFAISAGDAFETPSWRALLPELVPREDLAAASALNGIEFNLARATGPALAGILIAVAGVASAFALNALSFVGVLVVVARWRRPRARRTTPSESLGGATVAALRFVRYSPGIRAVTIRAGIVMFFASSVLALLPLVARQSTPSPLGYGILLGTFGGGALIGAGILPWLRARWSTDFVVSAAVVLLGSTIAISSQSRSLLLLAPLMILAGSAWIVFISILSALAQILTPDWVRARVVAIFVLAFQGGLAAGSVVWGVLADRIGLGAALAAGGVGTACTSLLGLLVRLPTEPASLDPSHLWLMPTVAQAPSPDDGPVLVTIEHTVPVEQTESFLDALEEMERVRRRDGAFRWGVYRDTEQPDHFIEAFLVASWAEHARQHERLTKDDQKIAERLSAATVDSKVRHFLVPRQD